ncbi:MAG TPA: nicotinate-nucleotide--dimethylbenzimidazole phosphoribosyltransferase [Thermoleophilaceae bacterium]
MPDATAARAVRAALDAKTKPRGSLGRIEDLARRIAAIRGSAELAPLRAAIVVAAADHGVATEGVSAYPPEVTAQMVANFARGGAAINVLARRAGAELVVVDAGTLAPCREPGVRVLRAGAGTANFVAEPAMSPRQCALCIESGIALARELGDGGVGIVGLGEMGIGNSTSAAAITAALLDREPREVCGRGTGVDDEQLARKVGVVGAALRRHQGREPLEVLAAVGGFEIAFLTGVALGAAGQRLVVLLDGFIATSAALVATALEPNARHAMIAAHLSPEPGHALALESLELRPLLDLGMRLGEGTGAALALPIVQSALAIVAEMATFADAGVSDAGG